MNSTAATTARRASLALALSLAACAGAPDVAIVSPAPGSTVGAAADLDPATPGLQLAVDATTSAIDGSDGTAVAGGAPAHATAQNGRLHFPSVTFADGATVLTVAVVDQRHDKVGLATANYSIDAFTRGCRISNPANHSSLQADPGDTGLVSVVVQAVCRGLPAGVQVGLLENSDEAPSQLQAPGPDGSVSFNADLIPGQNLLSVVAPGVAYDAVLVELASSRCRAELVPPSGARFNLAGTGGAIGDLDPANAGLQAELSVDTDCPDGAQASLSISSGGSVVVTSASTVHAGSAVFPVTLPDGALDAQAFVGAPGQEGASRHASYASDGTAPAIAILSPVSGGLLGPQDNVGTASQFVARIRGQLSGEGSGGFAAIELDQGTSQAMELPVAADPSSGIFSVDVPLSAGSHALSAKVQRASGNAAASPAIGFTVVLNGTALVIASPADGSSVGLSQLTQVTGGAQAIFSLESAGLIGASVALDCGSGVTASGTIGLDGRASIPVTLPIASCAGALFRCTAVAGATAATPVTFTADDTAPTVTINLPLAGLTSATSTALQATTSCPDEGQLFTLDNGGTVIASGSVQNNTVDLQNVALHAGQNQLHLTVTDAAQNSVTAEVDVTSSSSAFPQVAFVAPQSAALLGPASTLLDCTTPAKPVLKSVQVSISGDTVAASGLVLKLANSGGSQTVSETPTFSSGTWSWSNVQLLPESNTFSISATDGGGVTGQASVTFAARCKPLGVVLTLAGNGSGKFGYAQDLDHATAGLQLGVQVTAAATNGAQVRLCSTALSATPGGCITAGTGAVAVAAGAATIQSGAASFTATLPDGAQSIYAEVSDVVTEVSAAVSATVRALPPTVASIALAEDLHGQTLNSGPDDALNQTELDAANGTVHFQVVFGSNSFVAQKTVQIFSTSSPTVLGSATVAANGDGTTATSVPVALAQLNPGGYQSYVFYASVSDDANNKDSIPGAPAAGVPATTLGTTAAPFVIAPLPTVTLTSPAPGTSGLNASNDVRCSGGVCPDSDPLVFAFAATTTAPDSSASGATSAISFLSGGAAITPLTGESNPTAPSGGAVSGVDLPISNGPAIALAAQVDDPYGNLAVSPAATLLVDTIPPQLSISQIAGQSTSGGTVTINQALADAVVSIDAAGQGTLEAGQQVTIYEDGTAIGSATYAGPGNGAGSVTISIAVSLGSHQLVAKATDASGNGSATAAVTVIQTYLGPTLVLQQPAPVSGGTLWFGLSTKIGATCAPALTFKSTNVPDGNAVQVWLVAAGASCGSAPGNAQSANVTSNSATVSTAAFAIADAAAGKLCAQTTDGLNTVEITPQAFQCDLQTPTVAWVSPSAAQKFVAFGQSQIAGATPSTSSSNTKLGLASAQLTVKAPTGGTLVLSVDQDNTPSVTTTQFVSCAVPAASSAQSIYALSANNCSTSPGSGQLLLPIDFAQLLAHTLTASFTAASGNTATSAAQSVNIDVAPPAAVSPTFSLQRAIGVATLTIPTVPGDDQTVGASPAGWEVRYSSTALTANNWSSGTLVTANLAGAFPTGVPTIFQVVLPAGNAALSLGVRAKDRAGNLGDLAANGSSVLTLDTQPTGSVISLKDDSGSAPTSAFGQTMRVADLDGDGFDDVILNYPSAHCDANGCDGRIIVYFGKSGGIANPTAPLVLAGSIQYGYLGSGQSFDVGDFDADGKVDIAASETDYVSAHVLIWRGASIATWKAAAGTFSGTLPAAPAPVVLSDASALVGGTVRAVGHLSGGATVGDDLLVSNYQLFDSSAGPFQLGIFKRGGAWSTAGSTKLFSTGSPATTFIDLPAEIDSDSNAALDGDNVEAATFTYASTGGDLPGLLVSIVYVDTTTAYPNPPQNEHDIRLFGGDVIGAGGTLQWASATALPITADIDVHALFGYSIAGGRDAVGDGHSDMLLANADTGILYVYDGAQLLGTQVPATGLPAILAYNALAEGGKVGAGAALLPDLDGDGKAEITGAANSVAGARPVYVWFGQTGDGGALTQPALAAQPALPFFPAASCAVTATTFCFSPGRGQELAEAPLFGGSTFGQAVGAGHLTSQAGRDLVILSQPINSDGAHGGSLVLMR